MKRRTTILKSITAFALLFVCTTASANYLVPVDPKCNYKSLLHPDCVVCESVVNFTRDYPMGRGYPPSIDAISVERLNPYPGEYANILIKATSDGGATDGVGAQRIMAVEVSYSLTDGRSWYTNNWDSTRIGTGIPADFFRREKMTPKNTGSSSYVQYVSSTTPWAVSPESVAFATGAVPAPNRRCELDPMLCNKAAYPFPYSDDCPWGLTCPLYDTFTPNKGEAAGVGWPSSSCNQPDGDCNVPGFPEGGGDVLDNFPSLDPYPMDEFPNVPGEPLIRVNGVPAVDCDIYNGTLPSRGLHPLCNVPIIPDDKKAYEKFGVYSYKITPGTGAVRFSYALNPLDNVDAAFYSGDMTAWTAKLDLTTLPLSAVNTIGGTFVFHAKVYDTCGNLASGAQSPPYPPFPGENNEAYVGVYDFYFDQVPTDQDPMGQIAKDDGGTKCFSTDTLCPADGMTTAEKLAAGGCPAYPGCECCYNECGSSQCTYDGNIRNNVSAMCSNVGNNGNPPGCGPEFGSPTNYGTQEIREFKMSHTAANLYLKTRVQGDVLWGCYGSWYPLVGCEYSFGTLGSKFGGYGAQLLNTASDPPATYYLIVIPDIPIYGSLPLLIDLNAMLADLMGSTYDGEEMERYADGGGGCKKPSEDTDPIPPCEKIGCDPDANPSGDCDGDGYVNGTDSCPCEEADPTTDDGCPLEDPGGGDPLADYKCASCTTGTQGSSLYVEMGIEDTLGDSQGGAYQALAMTLTIHDLNMDWLLYYACLNGMNLLALGQDQSPRISYYPFGARGRSEVELVQDYTAPEEMRSDKTMACLGRCDESDTTDGIDNDGDLMVLEPNLVHRVDEGYDPTATQFEFKFQEIVANNDAYKSNLTDLGGYQIQIGRDPDGPFETLYVMCDSTADASCYGLENLCDASSSCTVDADCENGNSCISNHCCMGGPRDNPTYDEPYNGAISAEKRTRFPNPFDETAPHEGYGFPGEMISCVVDSDCDPSNNLFNDDKDTFQDEGCWTSNCYDNNTQLLPDGQAYWLRVRAFDIPKDIGATDTFLINYTSYTTPTKVQILKNTYKPDPPDVEASYSMVYGGKAKVVWNPNREADIGGYAIYRCPANPLDAVIKTMDGTLAAYCANEDNFRMITKEIMDNLNGYYVDEGMGYYETGLGDGSASGTLSLTWGAPCTINNGFGQFIVDEKCNWDPAIHDVGVDGVAGGITLGEGDGLPTPGIPGFQPGEPFAYEWIDCSSLSTPAGLNNDLKLCGNIQDPSGGWWASSTALFDSEGDPLYLYDVTTKGGYDPAAHAPVLFYNGLVDGYKYFYVVKAVDSPYLGDGWNAISSTDNCDDGVTPYTTVPAIDGCVNPISSRTCDDKRIAFDWTLGGNCSDNSSIMESIPADTQMPQSPTSLSSSVQSSGRSVVLTWNTPEEDRTMVSFNVYRSTGADKLYACVHGGCETAPYADGCACDPTKPVDTQCYQDPIGDWDRVCDKPYKICTNPPYYTVEPQVQGCDTVPYNPGCICNSDSDCGTCGTYTTKSNCENFGCNWDAGSASCSGLKCTNQVSICMIDQSNPPTGYAFENDRMDNDGDGLIDEETALNGIDEDGDGLVDEDVGIFIDSDNNGMQDANELIVGYCPDKTYPYWDEKNWRSQERVMSETFTDNSVQTGKLYNYRVQAMDNAVYDPNDFSSNDHDPPPPNFGLLSSPTTVDMTDILPPNNVTGYCNHPVTGLPMPCVSIMDVSTYEFACNDDIEDFEDDNYGGMLSIRWRRNSDVDVYGYYVYRASDKTNSGIEPPSGAFSKANDVIINQSAPDIATDAICFKNTGLQNNLDYYYAVTVVDIHGNESVMSEVAGPTKAIDSIAPMTPTWGTTGGATPDVAGSKISINWEDHENYAAAKLAVSDPSETDFSHFVVYRSNDDDECEPTELCTNSGTCSTSADCASGKTCYQGLCCNGGTTCCGGEYTDSAFVDGFVAMDTEYYYCISAFDTNDNESTFLELPSPAKAVDQVPPVAPTGLVASRMENSEIGLGWKQSAESDILCYKPYFSNTSTNTGTFSPIDLQPTDIGYITVTNVYSVEVECLDELSFIHTNITDTGNIYYRLTAVDTNGNESALSAYVVTMTTPTDFYAPPYPERIYTRAGFHRGETGGSASDGTDNDGNAFIDEALINLKTRYSEIYWDRVREPDVAKYEIYMSAPPDAPNCTEATCDVTANPLGDCDNDGTVNSIDDCPCTPTSPSTNQFGNYTLFKELNAADNCPTAKARPVGTQIKDICLYPVTDAQCAGSRYWYSVVPVDANSNSNGLNKSYAMAATTVPNPDIVAPDKPSKPKIAVVQSGKNLVVKFLENEKVEPNLDLAGYIIYRDSRPTGSFDTKLAMINDTSKLKYCIQAGQPPCYCDEVAPEYACLLDISVEEGKRYYYKISAFDFNGNESEKSDWNYAIPSAEAPVAITGFVANPKKNDDFSLNLSWNSGNLLDNQNVAGFRISRASAQDGTYQLIDPVPDTTAVEPLRASSFLDTGLARGTTYWYMIVTYSNDGLESPSEKTCGVPGSDIFPPSTPSGVRLTNGNNEITLSWSPTPDTDLAGYNVYRSLTRDFKNAEKVNTGAVTYPSFKDTTVTNNTLYYYCIKSYDSGPNYDENGCYSGYSTESSCSAPAVLGVPNNTSSGVSKMVTVSRGWNLLAASGNPSVSLLTDTQENTTTTTKTLIRLTGSGSAINDSTISAIPEPEIISGSGMWYYSETDGQDVIQLNGTFIPAGTVDLALNDGWNLIGSPFIDVIIWNDDNVLVSTDGGSTYGGISSSPAINGVYFWDPETTGYIKLEAGGLLHPGSGVFIKSSGASILRLVRE